MAIVITTSTDSLDGPFDPRFGRAAYFCLVDAKTGDFQAFPNAAVSAAGGAGVQASQFIGNHGAEAVISGDFGPNAYMTLNAAGIRMYLAPAGESLTGRQLLERYRAGELQEATGGPTHGGRHGGGGRGRRR